MLIAFSVESTFKVYLPAVRNVNASLQLMIVIRDQRDCVTEWTNLSSIVVQADDGVLDDLIKISNGELTSNPFTQLLKMGNQNQVGQVTSSLFQYLNKHNAENLQKAIAGPFSSSLLRASYLSLQGEFLHR